MKVAVLGGTGAMGGAVAKQLSKNNAVVIGSRDPARAEEAAKSIKGAIGSDYATATREAQTAVFAIPYSAIGEAAALANELKGKLVISMFNPLKFEGGMLHFSLEKGSAAEELAALLPDSRVATAFNNVPSRIFEEEEPVPMDILVAADLKETYDEAAALVRSIPNLRPLYVGPLSQAQMVERTTALVLNLAKLNKTGALAPRFVSRKG
ncbi:MAG TPA: NAD(P)-binding domain-containing protein [Nitrososphaerales archaeon]|nr:NAD(P)-binding domain-containing protein [Nitrososphaerales archaeon]